MPSFHASGAFMLAFCLQLIIAGFLLRTITAFLLRRNPDSSVGNALAYVL